jgi:hypothetical protein
LIETDNAGDVGFYLQISMNSSGAAIAVWEQSDGTHVNIWANRFDGSTWGTAELIETDNTGDAGFPKIGLEEDGSAVAVWEQFDGVLYNIWANRFDGSAWGTPELIETDNSGRAGTPEIGMQGNNDITAVWDQFDGTHWNIWANQFNGSEWGTPELIETDNAGDAVSPRIGMDSSGSAIVVWQRWDGTRYNIWSNRFDGFVWGTPEQIDTNTNDASQPQISMDNTGTAIAVWHQFDGTHVNIWANRFDGSAWGTPELIETDNAGDAIYPHISMDDTGSASAVWRQSDGIRYNAWANRFDGSTWGTPELIETDNAGDVLYPRISMDSTGTAIAVWGQSDGIRYNIWANRFNGSAWGTPELIETDNAGDALYPQISMDDVGTAIAVWGQSDGTRYNAWANRFE